MHQPIPEQGKWLKQVVTGYFNYHAVPTNGPTLTAFRFHVTNLWRRTLRRRSQKDWTTKERTTRLANDWLPKPRKSFTPGQMRALQSDTQGGSRMPELGPYGSVRGARGNSRPYRDLRNGWKKSFSIRRNRICLRRSAQQEGFSEKRLCCRNRAPKCFHTAKTHLRHGRLIFLRCTTLLSPDDMLGCGPRPWG